MRSVLAILALVVFPVLAAPASAEDRAAIQGVIGDQIAAFRADDGPRAYGHAAPSIKRLFPTPDIFMTMVRRGYRPVYRPRGVTFLDLTDAPDGRPIQAVRLVGPDGLLHTAYYRMERQPDGSWKIAGVWLEREEGGLS